MAERWYTQFARVLGHTFVRRQPIVLYASHPHFSQTNLTGGTPTESTGGFTERLKSRIAMPFAAGLAETDHVPGPEIAHAFQIDIARRVGQDAFALPLWFIEGMAENPSWSPDGTRIAFATDRFTSDAGVLQFGALRVGVIDLAGGAIRPLEISTPRGRKEINPQWAPDGRSLYFVSDRTGASNVYRVELDSGRLYQVTDVWAGVSGLTASSPSLAVAARAAKLAYTVYGRGGYRVRTLAGADARAGVPVDSLAPVAAASDDQERSPGADITETMAGLLADAAQGLPDGSTFVSIKV
ncbi:MAG TPA: hypothetical protein VNI78_07620 [Vicinamibacterales bacterium]|nr:hypothetical protein [Vicinamibacterales bacterium]